MALFADMHGHTEILKQALNVCRREQVQDIVLLGDLIDRDDQADACALLLVGWNVSGVFGNHEQELMDALTMGTDLGLRRETIDLFMSLKEHIVVENVCFCHDGPPQLNRDEIDLFYNRAVARQASPYHIIFSGHTHFRDTRDEHGPLELAANSLPIRAHRRYRINPGALTAGQFAIWDRAVSAVRFFTVR